jgi:CBS domain-containing protein
MAVKTAVASMIERAVSALYDADPVGGLYEADLLPIVSATGNAPRATAVLRDLVESERLVQAAGAATHGGPRGPRYKLSPSERHAEFERRFHLYKPKEKYVERGNA